MGEAGGESEKLVDAAKMLDYELRTKLCVVDFAR